MKAVRWGVFGASGHFRKKVALPALEAEGVELRAVASRDAERAGETAATLGVPHHYGSYEELLADAEIEAVYIPLPNHLHLEWIRRAADAGKHVLCEKPLGLDAAQVSEAAEYCRQKGVLLMEAFMYRFHPQWTYARDLIRSGKIGLEPKRVVALVNRHPEWKTDTLTSAVLDFGGPQATFVVGTQTFAHQHVTVLGSGGSIAVELPFNTHPDVPAGLRVRDSIGMRRVEFGPVDHCRAELEAFSRAVREGATEAPTPVADAIANQRVLDALFASEQSGGWEPAEQ